MLETPTVVDRAIAAAEASTATARARQLAAAIDATAGSDPQGAANFAYELGELYERQLADEERALAGYRRAIELDATFAPATWGLRRVLYRRQRWAELLKLIDQELARLPGDASRSELLVEKARVLSLRGAGDAEARGVLEAAIAADPAHQPALLELERVVARLGDVAALLDVYLRLAEVVEHPARKISYWTEAAQLATLPDLDRVLPALDDAARVASVAQLAPWAAERVARERLRLVDMFNATVHLGAAMDALAAALNATAASDPSRRRELVALRRRQALHVRTEMPINAWDYLQQARELAPTEPVILVELIELASELGRHRELAELVRKLEGDAGPTAMLAFWAAEAHLRPERRAPIRSLLKSLEANAPGSLLLMSAAECDALADPGRDAARLELAGAYLAAAAATAKGSWLGAGPLRPDPSAAAALYLQAAELYAHHTRSPQSKAHARAALAKALELAPEHPAVLEAWIELADAAGDADEALAKLRAMAIASHGDRAVVERALRVARKHGRIETVLELERDLVTLVPDDAVLAWRLEAALFEVGRDAERAELLAKIAKIDPDPGRRQTALLWAARLQERAGADELATELYRQLLALTPGDMSVRDALIDLLRMQGRWEELARERRAEARELEPPAARRPWREAAWVLEVLCDDAEAAAEVYAEWWAKLPEDRTALEGLARCRSAMRDHEGEVLARAAIVALDPTTDACWLHARSLERAGQLELAAEQYRRVIASEDSQVAATSAALALASLATRSSSMAMRVEAADALAQRTTATRLAGALLDECGWTLALALDDDARATEAFDGALMHQPGQRGTLLGAALVAARQDDPARLAKAYGELAETALDPKVVVALGLRAATAAITEANTALANGRVDAARAAAPDDAYAIIVASETTPIARVDLDDPFDAGDQLLARGELFAKRAALAEDPAARSAWELDRAELLERAGQLREAGAAVAQVLARDPDDRRALSALRRIARRGGDRVRWAQASFALARRCRDPENLVQLLRDAAEVYDAPGRAHDAEYACGIYRRIVAAEPDAPELDRLLALLRERGDAHELVDVVTERLRWLGTESPPRSDLMVPLLLERSSLLQQLDRAAQAVVDLDALLEYAPNHAEALRSRADLAVGVGDIDRAVALWWRYLAVETVHARRAEIEVRLERALGSDEGVAPPPPATSAQIAAAPDPDSTDIRSPVRTGTRQGIGAQRAETATHTETLETDLITSAPRTNTRRGPAIIRRTQPTPVPQVEDELGENTMRADLSELQEAERREVQMFESNTALTDLSDLQESERREATKSTSLSAQLRASTTFDEPTVEGPPRTTKRGPSIIRRPATTNVPTVRPGGSDQRDLGIRKTDLATVPEQAAKAAGGLEATGTAPLDAYFDLGSEGDLDAPSATAESPADLVVPRRAAQIEIPAIDVTTNSAIEVAVGASVDEMTSLPSSRALSAPLLEIAARPEAGGPAREPDVDAAALAITEERAAAPDDSAVVVMLSYQELQPALADDALAATLRYCEREIAASDEPAVLAALRIEAGRMSEAIGSGDEARAHYDAALVADPRSRTALASLRRIARSEGELVEVTRLVDAELAFASGVERDALVRYRLDLLLARGERDAARTVIDELLARTSDDLGALLARLELAARADDDELLDAVLDALATAISDADLRAGVQTARSVRAERAGKARPAALVPAGDGPQDLSPRFRIAAIRQAVGQGNPELVGQELLELAYHVEGEDPMTAAALAVRAQVWIRDAVSTGEGRGAISEAAQLAARIAARDPLVARIATESALVANDTTIAIHAFARWVRCKSAPAERAYAAARAAELEPVRFGRMWSQVLDLDPGDDYAIAKLRTAHLDAGEIQPAVELDLRRARETGKEAPILEAVSHLISVSHHEEALAALTRAREEHPASRLLAEALAEVYGKLERWTERAKLLGEIASAPGALASGVYRRRSAQAWDRAARSASGRAREELEQVTMAALDAWDLVREADPTSPLAHASTIALASGLDDPELLIEALSYAQAAERSPSAAASLALRRARLLLDNDPRLAIEVARDAAKGLDDPRLMLGVMMAAAHRRELGDAVAALEERAAMLDTAAQAAAPCSEASMLRVRAAQLALDAGDAPRATRLLARVDATWPGVAELADVARRRSGAPPAKTSSYMRVLRDADAAAARNEPVALVLYQRALELQPGDPLAAAPLVRLAAQLRQPNAIAKYAQDQVSSVASASAAAKVDAHELVALVDQLRGDTARAHAALEAASLADPSRMDLAHRLERTLAAGSRYRELLAVREREVAIVVEWLRAAAEIERRVGGAADLAPMVVDAAMIALHDKRQDAELARLYAAVVAAEPQHMYAFLQLEALARRGGNSAALAQLQAQVAALFDDLRIRAALLMRVGETLAATGEPEEAVLQFERAVKVAPDYQPALEAWLHHALVGKQWDDVARAATHNGQHHLAGVVLMDKAAATVPAIEAFRRALEVEPGHRDTFARLRILYERSGQLDALAALLRKRLEIERDPKVQADLHRSLAEQCAHLGDRKTALQHYRLILTVDPADVRAHAAIADLVTEPATWQEAAAAVAARIPIEQDPKILGSLHYRLGVIYTDHDVAQALASFQRAASYKPDDVELLKRITDLAIRVGDWKVALEACEHLVTTERDPDKLAANLNLAAMIFSQGFNDLERTERMLTLALESAPTNQESLRLLVQFYREAGNAPGLRLQMSRLAGVMRNRIAQDPMDGIAYRTLARASSARGEPAALPIARAAAELAQILGAGGEPEQRLAATLVPELSMIVGPNANDRLLSGAMQPELRRVFELLGEPIARHVGSDLGVYDVSRKNRLRPSEPVAATAREVAAALGFVDVDVYVSTRRQFAMVAEPTNPVSLVLGASIAAAGPRDVRFAAGAALKLAQMSLAIPARLPPDELGVLVLAVLRVFAPDMSVPGIDLGEVSAQVPRLRKLIPAGLFNEVQPIAARVAGFEPAAIAQALTIAGLRAGWAASGSLMPGLAILAGAVGTSVPSVLGHPITNGLVSYALADATLGSGRVGAGK